MNSLLETLEAKEPTISAIVGLLTIGAAAWGFLQLALLPFLAAREARGSVPEARGEATPAFRLWSSLINRGVDSRADYIEQISGRTLNACLVLLIAAALAMLLLTLQTGQAALSVVNLFMFLMAVSAYNAHSAGFPTSARWLLIVAVILYWNFNILLMGTRVGLEYCLGGVLLVPLLVFEKGQERQMYAAATLALASLPLTVAAESQVSEIWPFNTASPPPLYYLVNAVLLAFLVFFALYFYNRSADASFRELEDQEQKTSELIHALLPAYIAEKMAAQGSNVADWHSEGSVLFATVTGFERLYKRVSAVQLVELLRQLFEEFDELVEGQGVEKINTLGTNYVAATGIDASRSATTTNLARVALGMRSVVERLSETVDHPFGVRIGLSTGDVVSGVVGDERPCFDIWGQTVELANTMREAAANDTIVVNEAAYWRLKSAFSFEASSGAEGAFILVDAS